MCHPERRTEGSQSKDLKRISNMPNSYYTYMMTNQSNTTLYIGVTNNIERRALEHMEGSGAAFTSKYKINKLIYFERYTEVTDAIK